MSETAAAMLTCIQYPWLCRQTSETTGLTLQGLPHCHRAATQRRMYVCIMGGKGLILPATNPLLSSLGLAACFPSGPQVPD